MKLNNCFSIDSHLLLKGMIQEFFQNDHLYILKK